MRAERLALALCIGAATLGVGCRQRAFTELYVENMAGEIRELENRVYEYDSAYQSMEQELIDLQRTNDELQRRLDNAQTSSSSLKSDEPMRLAPRDSKQKSKKERQPESVLELDAYDPPAVVVPSLGDKNKNKNANPKSEELSNPPMSIQPPGESKGTNNVPEALPPPLRVTPESANPLPSASDSTLGNAPDNSVPEVPRKSVLPAPPPIVPGGIFPGGSTSGGTGGSLLNNNGPFNNGSAPSTLGTPGTSATPSATDANGRAPIFPSAFPGAKDSGKNRIPVPGYGEVRQASANIPIANGKQSQPVQDTRVNEIAFHPTLCRGHNFDSVPGDDGLYLVIVPQNSAGQPLNEVGKLTVVVEDDEENGLGSRVAAWEVSENELRENLTPIGMSQGFHLSLPWQEKQPAGNKVSVYIRYALRDGRTMVNRRDLQLHRPTTAQSTWTPR